MGEFIEFVAELALELLIDRAQEKGVSPRGRIVLFSLAMVAACGMLIYLGFFALGRGRPAWAIASFAAAGLIAAAYAFLLPRVTRGRTPAGKD